MMTESNISIPYVNLAMQHESIMEELLQAAKEVLASGKFVLGSQVAEFEQEFAALTEVKHAIGVNSGTDALMLALRVCGVGPGDEVITVPNSFITTTSAIQLLGARTVFVDVSEDLNIDVTKIEDAITPKTKAIVPVHLTGRPCDMRSILRISEHHGLTIIEDCAQAVMAQAYSKKVGSFGELGCFSLHPLKTLNACGDGGVITFNDPRHHKTLQSLRNNGLVDRIECQYWSSNSRLDTLQAAFLLVKLKYLQLWTEKRQRNASLYSELLAKTKEVHCPMENDDYECVYHTYVVQVELRDELREYLSTKGIQTSIHYPKPIHLTSIGKELGYKEGDFPRVEALSKKILSLPIHQNLRDDDIRNVCGEIVNFYKR